MRAAAALAFLLILFPARGHSQTPGAGEPDLERLLQSTDSEVEYSAVLDRLLRLREHPYDLRTVTQEELRGIPGVGEAGARAVLALRLRLGGFTSVGQLDSLDSEWPGLSAELLPYVRITGPAGRGRGSGGTSVDLRSRVRKDLQIRRGFLDGSYAGSRYQAYTRLLVRFPGDLEGGALFEKDAGEVWNNGLRSGYVEARGLPWEGRVIGGDYTVSAGQGLMLWNATSFEQALGPSGAARRSEGVVVPNRSTDESGFLRGVALSLTPPPGIGVTAFFSTRDRAASLNDAGEITSFDASGLFRTPGEIRKYRAVVERTVGGRLETRVSPAWRLGVTISRSTLSAPLHPDRVPTFRSGRLTLTGVDGWLRSGDVFWFGEAARTAGGGEAFLCGAVLAIGLRTEAAVSYRSFGVDYVALRGAGFGRETRNERGVALSLGTTVSRVLRLTGSFDHYRHPWHTPGRVFPSGGAETVLQAEIRPRPRSELVIRYTRRRTETLETTGAENGTDRRIQDARSQQNLRFSASLEPDRRVRWRTRLEAVDVAVRQAGRHEVGLLLYQDIRYSTPWGLTIEARLAFFDTESYDSRVYEYENDLRGVFTSPPLYGKGSRWYVLLRSGSLLDLLTVSCKYAATRRDGVRSTGSGDSEIDGDLDDRLGVQVDLRW